MQLRESLLGLLSLRGNTSLGVPQSTQNDLRPALQILPSPVPLGPVIQLELQGMDPGCMPLDSWVVLPLESCQDNNTTILMIALKTFVSGAGLWSCANWSSSFSCSSYAHCFSWSANSSSSCLAFRSTACFLRWLGEGHCLLHQQQLSSGLDSGSPWYQRCTGAEYLLPLSLH